jgi:hypothetical protein
MKELVKCKIPIRFPTKPNHNNLCFTKESLETIGLYLDNAPITKAETGDVIGILSGSYETNEKENETIVLADAMLWVECNPEVTVCEIKKEDNVSVIHSFVFNSVSI